MVTHGQAVDPFGSVCRIEWVEKCCHLPGVSRQPPLSSASEGGEHTFYFSLL